MLTVKEHSGHFLKKNIIYTIALFFERSIIFILLPFYTKLLPVSDYGIYTLILVTISVGVFLYTFGIENGLLKLTAEEKNINKLDSTCFWGMLIPSVIFTIVIILFAEIVSGLFLGSKLYYDLVIISALILFSDNLGRFFLYKFAGGLEAKLFFLTSITKGLLLLILNYYFLGILNYGLRGIFYAYLITSLVIALILLLRFGSIIKFVFDINLYKKLLRFGLPMMINSLLMMLITFADNYLLQYFQGPEQVGYYSSVYKFGLGMNLIATAFITTALPYSSKLFSENDNPALIIRKTTRQAFYAAGIIFLIAAIFSQELTGLKIAGYQVLNFRYHKALNIIPLLMFSYTLMILYHSFTLALYKNEKTILITKINLIALVVNIGLNFVLISFYGYNGAAISTFVSLVTLAAITYYFSLKEFNTGYRAGDFMWFLIPGLIISFIYFADIKINMIVKVIILLAALSPLIIKLKTDNKQYE